MTDEIVFYTNPMSRGRIARWMLEEVGVPYRAEALDYGPPMRTPGYLAVNPMAKVPAITHRGIVVTECAAICAYLADAFPAARLAPPPLSPLRGPYYRWLMFAAGPIEAAAGNKALGVGIPEDKQGMIGYGSLDRVTETLEKHLSANDHLAGDGFTAADLYVSASLGWLTQFGIIEKRPAIMTFVARHTSRPAKARADALDDALLPAQN